MCMMAPAHVVRTDGTYCEVELGGQVERFSMLLEPGLQVGDWVLVTSGTVVRRLDPDQAAEMRAAIEILYGPEDAAARPSPAVLT